VTEHQKLLLALAVVSGGGSVNPPLALATIGAIAGILLLILMSMLT
jgi:hypothetical protein